MLHRGQGLRRELSRPAHHRGPLSVQAAAAVRAGRRGGRHRRGRRRRREESQARRPRDRLRHRRRHGREARRGGRPLHPHAGRHAVRRGERADPHLRHLHPRPEGPRQAQEGRDAAGARRRRRRRPFRRRTRQGVRRARDRGGLVGGQARASPGSTAPTTASSIRPVPSTRPARRRWPTSSSRPAARRAPTSSTIRSAATTRKPRCAPSPGRAASWSSASRPASPNCRST